MILFDKIKIIASINHVYIIYESKFNHSVKKGVLRKEYKREKPSFVKIGLNYANGESIIEFTGKILGYEYPNLISRVNVKQCLMNFIFIFFFIIG